MAQPMSNANNTHPQISRSTTFTPREARNFIQSPVPSPKHSQNPPKHPSFAILRSNSNSSRSINVPHAPPPLQQQNPNFYHQSSQSMRSIPQQPKQPTFNTQQSKSPRFNSGQSHMYSPRAQYPQQQQAQANWNSPYIQQPHAFPQQQYAPYFYGQWSLPSAKYLPYTMPNLPPPPPPPPPEDDEKKGQKTKDTKDTKDKWKQIEQSDDSSPSLSSSSCLSDITDGDYAELKLTPVAFGKSQGADKDRLIGILQKLPSDDRIERIETSHISSLSSLPQIPSFKVEQEEEEELEIHDEQQEIQAEQDATDPEIVIYDDIKTADENSAPWETSDDPIEANDAIADAAMTQDNEGLDDHHKGDGDKAPWETSDDDTSVEPQLKNADILGTKKLSITVKGSDILSIAAVKHDEGDGDGDGDHDETRIASVEDEDDDEKEVSDYDEYLKKQEIEQYEQYIKKHNKKKKKKKKKKKQHKSPIYIEESMCYDLWDLHEIQEMEQQRIEKQLDRRREIQRVERMREEEAETERIERKKKKKGKKKEKKKLFHRQQTTLTPRQRKKRKEEKEAMNLSKAGFRVRVNRRYRLDDGRIGICRFRGRTVFGKGGEDWIGIMIEYGEGEHDGCVEGKNYFRCKDGRGIMVRPQRIIQDLGLPNHELDARTIYDTKAINHLMLYRQRSATSMYD